MVACKKLAASEAVSIGVSADASYLGGEAGAWAKAKIVAAGGPIGAAVGGTL